MFTQVNLSHYYLIGCMSGTSLDGIDLAYVKFTKREAWSFQILASTTIDYSENWKKKLSESFDLPPFALEKLNVEYTDFLGGVIGDFISKEKIKVLDAVASHGHTVFHQPEKGLTLQIGNLSHLADRVGWPVICDFRVQDIALGGQGAPLVPMGDLVLFSKYQACVNLGGFSNISISQNQSVQAYDICAVNTVLNILAQRLDLPYDAGGKIAAEGKIIPEFLQQLDQIHFYSKKPPKSLGIEWVQECILSMLKDYPNAETQDLLHTYILHIAKEIAKCLPEEGSVLFTGGGAYNTFLVEAIQKRTKAKIVVPSPDIVDYKEALIFAFLGLMKWQGSINCLASVTGAERDHASGKIFIPNSQIG
ncbi:MAG: anhydro-N-acetylmuramic acid kinase [Flavobacteriaceae bacterium]